MSSKMYLVFNLDNMENTKIQTINPSLSTLADSLLLELRKLAYKRLVRREEELKLFNHYLNGLMSLREFQKRSLSLYMN